MTLSVVRGIRGLRVLWWQHLLYDKLCSCSESRQLHNKCTHMTRPEGGTEDGTDTRQRMFTDSLMSALV